MTDKIHENWVKPTVPTWEEIKPPRNAGDKPPQVGLD